MEARGRRGHARRDRAAPVRGAVGRPRTPRPADRSGQSDAPGRPHPRGGRGPARHGSTAPDRRTPDPHDADRLVPEHRGVAVYLLDLDNFKEINDATGTTWATICSSPWPVAWRPSSGRRTPWPDSGATSSWWSAPSRAARRRCSPSRTASRRPWPVPTGSTGGPWWPSLGRGGVRGRSGHRPSKLLSLADDAMYGVKWSRRRAAPLPVGLTVGAVGPSGDRGAARGPGVSLQPVEAGRRPGPGAGARPLARRARTRGHRERAD